MTLVNGVLVRIFDLVVLPFRDVPALFGLAVLSLAVSVGILMAFRATSNQDALKRVKRGIHAGVYEIRLFKDDLRTIVAAQADIFRHTVTYARLSLVPMLLVMAPIVLVVIQLQFRYGYASLEPGRSVVVQAVLTPAGAARVAETSAADVVLEPPLGVRVETPVVWIPSLREVAWRVRAQVPGEHELVLRIGDEAWTKSIRVAGSTVLRSPVRPAGLLGQILYPAEAPLPDGSAVEAIRVRYADAEVSLLGWETHWMIAFFVLTMVFAFVVARPMGVEI